MLNATQSQPLNGNDPDNALQSEVEYRTKLQEIGNKINAARDLDEILIDLKDEITEVLRRAGH